MNSPLPPSHSPDVPNFYYTNRVLQHPQLSVGDFTYGVPDIRWLQQGINISIGKFCSISSEVVFIMGGNHRADWISQYPFPNLVSNWPQARGLPTPVSRGHLTIGHDVWIGNGATIMSGITIGNGAVIGARAVAAKDVPPYAVVVGNPARVVKYRFTPEKIAALQRIAWWDWPVDIIEKHADLLCSVHVDALERLAEHVQALG